MFTPKGSPADGQHTTPPQRVATKSHRALACEVCQKRKVKCDKNVPCGSCVQAGVECVQTTLPRVRRRRFPERELLERLRHYENLLRRNNIRFDPLHQAPSGKTSTRSEETVAHATEDDPAQAPFETADATSRTSSVSGGLYEAKSIWHAINQRATPEEDDDDEYEVEPMEVRAVVIKNAWDQSESHDNLLFGTHTKMDLPTMHPDQIQIFRLWQIYLENVDPLLKVTHSPTLQPRLIDAARDVEHIPSPLAALMFGIYCVALISLEDDDCISMFGSPKRELLNRYRGGCQQALHDSKVLRSGDRDCLTALYLYLVSVRLDTDPRSLSATLGMAIRIAQRMKLHHESANARCTMLEAELRRRLWWSLALFDSRISEMDGSGASVLTPLWDCKLPLNLNDADLQPSMMAPPTEHDRPTEAIFVVMRSRMGEFVRNSGFHLDFSSPILKSVATNPGTIQQMEKELENGWLRLCNTEHPVQYMTIWMARALLAKNKLMEHYNSTSVPPTEAQLEASLSHARDMLVCDTHLLGSSLTKRFRWLVIFQFPFPAYMYLALDLRRRPRSSVADKAWEVMSDNYAVRFSDVEKDNPFFKIFTRIIMQAWAAREMEDSVTMPPIVSDIKSRMGTGDQHSSELAGTDFSVPMLMDFDDYSLLFGVKDDPPSGPDQMYSTQNFGW